MCLAFQGSLKPINGSLSGCAVLCSAAVCSLNPEADRTEQSLSGLGWTQQGVEEGRLNKCVYGRTIE